MWNLIFMRNKNVRNGKIKKYFKKVWNLISPFFTFLGVLTFIYIVLKINGYIQFHYFCNPKLEKAVHEFINEVISKDFDSMGDNKQAFLNYDLARAKEKGAIFKNSKELWNGCKRDFSKHYKIIKKEWSFPGAAVFVEFENGSQYSISADPTRLFIFPCYGTRYKVHLVVPEKIGEIE